MDPEIEIIDDPYIGLRLQAWQVRQIQKIAITNTVYFAPMNPSARTMLDVWADIGAFLADLRERFKPENWWAWLYHKVWEPFQGWFWHNVVSPITSLWQKLQGSLLGWWEGAITRITNVINHLTDNIRNVIHDVVERLRSLLDRILGSIKARIEAIRVAIINKIEALINQFKGFIENLREMIRERISALISHLVEQARNLRERLSTIFATLWEKVTTSLKNFRERVWDAIMEGVSRLRKAISAALENLYTMVITAIRNWWKNHGQQILDAADRAIKIARPHIEKWVGEFQDLPKTFLEYIATGMGTNLALQPSRALTAAGTLYTTSILAGSLAMTTATALNAIPGTNWVGAQQFAAYIAQVAGFEPLTRATYGVFIDQCLTWPLRYHWNRQLRPRIPTEGTVFLMGRKRGLNKGEWKNAMAYHGIPDWWLDKIYNFFWTDPSPYWLLRMSEHATPEIRPSSLFLDWLNEWLPGWANDPMAWYKMKLMLAGFEDTDIPAFIDGFQRRRLTSPITQFKTSVRAMVREAYWLQEDAASALSPLKVPLEEIELLVKAEELDYQNKYMDEQVKLYIAAYQKEEIDAADLEVALSTIIMKPERVAQIVDRERIRKLPKPKTDIETKEDPDVAKVRSATVQAHIYMFRRRVIALEELYSYLLGDGLSQALARATTIKEASSRIKSPPLDSPYFLSKSLQLLLQEKMVAYDDLFAEGEITLGEYLTALLAMGLDEDTAIYLADVATLQRFLGQIPGIVAL